MDTIVPVTTKVRKVLRWVEWIILLDCVVVNLLLIDEVLPQTYWQFAIFVVMTSILSLNLPTHRTLGQRRGYVAAEFLILAMAALVNLDSSRLLSLFLIKACLLLPRREVIIAAAITVISFVSYITWQAPTMIELYQTIEPSIAPWQLVIDALAASTTDVIFVIMIGFVFVSEQRNRYRAEVLAQQVDAFAVQLERNRIARNIHDSLGHTLTTLDIELALADRYSKTVGSSSDLQQSITAAQQLVRQCLADVREALRTIRTSSFDLEDALQTLTQKMAQSCLVDLEVTLPKLPTQLSYQLYLIAKESLLNVQKHANATQVAVSILTTDGKIVLEISDNGRGFDPQTKNASGYGLQGITERLRLIGGQFILDSQPGQGTHMHVTVPYDLSHHPH